MLKTSISTLLLLLTLSVTAQNPAAPQIYVKGIVHNNKVLLRWVPADFGVFLKGNQYGYQVTRQLLGRNGVPVDLDERQQSTTVFGPFAPLSEADFEPLAANNNLAGVAQGAIYADDFQATMGNDPLYQALNANSQNENRYGFGLFAADQSFDIAGYMGLAFMDETASVETEGEYSYKVEVLTGDPATAPHGTGFVYIKSEHILPAPSGLQVKANGNRVLLSLPKGNLESWYTAFNLDRSEDGGATWQRRNQQPLTFMSNNTNSDLLIFSDSIEELGKTYRYRICGKSPFGIDGPNSNTADGSAPKPPLGILPDILHVEEINQQLKIMWSFPSDQNSQLLRFEVFRSDNAEGNFVKIAELNPSVRDYTDFSPSPLSNYYKVVAIDNGNSANESSPKLAQLNDTEPPAVPTGLAATVNSSGVVTLTWTKNLEPDLKGYRVFFSNVSDAEFAQLTSEVSTENKFTHQLNLNVLGKKVYFKILATDLRENISDFSATVFVDRPDIIPPVKPVLVKADPLPSGVQLDWINSDSDDVAKHVLQRRSKSDVAWTDLATYLPTNPVRSFLDSTTIGGDEIAYRVIAYDQGNLGSVSAIMSVIPNRINVDTISYLKAASAVEGAQKQSKLTWEYKGASEVQEFHVYRATGNGEPHLYATHLVDPQALEVNPVSSKAIFIWRDKDIDTGVNYKYRVVAKFRNGISSPLSRMINFSY